MKKLVTNVSVATAPAPPLPEKASANDVVLDYPYPLVNNLMLVTFPAVKVHVALIPTPAVAVAGVFVIVGTDV